MSASLHPGFAFVRHLAKAGNRHGVHSPFVFNLIEGALRHSLAGGRYPALEERRQQLLRSTDVVTVLDLGAGSRRDGSAKRRVASIARTALKPRKQAEQLARITTYYKPATILELGTSLGITTLYLAKSAPEAHVHTIEGSPQIAALAQAGFNASGAQNIRLHVGSFREKLPGVLGALDRLDLAYIDGHHAEEPTLHYFDQCLAKAHNDTVFLFDDIHWSEGMERAWQRIQAHGRVSVTIDLFHIGMVFLRREQGKEHFILRY